MIEKELPYILSIPINYTTNRNFETIRLYSVYFAGTFGRGGRGPAPLGRGGGTQVGNKLQNKTRPK